MVTVTVNPNNGGSAQYKQSATYLLSMTTGYDTATSQIVDYLESAPLLRANTPFFGAPTIVSANFVATGTNRRNHAAGGSFTITWDSNVVGTSAARAAISLHLLHATTG